MDAAIEKQSSFAFEYMGKRKVWHVPGLPAQVSDVPSNRKGIRRNTGDRPIQM